MGPTVWTKAFRSPCLCGNTIVPEGLEISAATQRARDPSLSPLVALSLLFTYGGGALTFARESGSTYKAYHATKNLIVLPPFLSRSSIFNVQHSSIHWPSHVTRAHLPPRGVVRRHLTETT